MSIELRESVTKAPVKRNGKWLARVAVPGQGSSGFYSEEVLKRDAANIIPKGGQAFINHDVSRNPKDMIGTYPEGSFWDEAERAVLAEMKVFTHWQEFVDEVGPHCGMSLFAMGESDEDGNILAILEDRGNGADLVARPGLVGSQLIEPIYESARSGNSENPSPAAGQETEGEGMNLEEMGKAVEALTAQVAALVAKEAAEKGEALQAEADATAVAAAVEAYDASRKLVDEADLLEPQRAAILESAKAGADVAPLIESAKAIKAAAVEAAKSGQEDSAPVGRVVSEAATKSALELGKVF